MLPASLLPKLGQEGLVLVLRPSCALSLGGPNPMDACRSCTQMVCWVGPGVTQSAGGRSAAIAWRGRVGRAAEHRCKCSNSGKLRRATSATGRTQPVPAAEAKAPPITVGGLLETMAEPESRIVGIDLSGSERRCSGWALLQGDMVVTGRLRTTEEILRYTLASKPALVSIDSPLTLPAGRDRVSDECQCRQLGISRCCERELRRRGISVYWCLIKSMQALTRRGIEIATKLKDAGVNVIESYPGAAQDIMRIPRKKASHQQLREGLKAIGLAGLIDFCISNAI